tara:strand:+ start:1036 stop:1419 length:384 start_codon:yes stop_codon:yes gene_type:complete
MPQSKEYMREWRANRSEEQKEAERLRNREYRRNNPQVKDKDKLKKYRQENHDKFRIGDWKRQGMKLKKGEDWESIYIEYIITEFCEECGCKLTDGKKNTPTTRCLDHDHDTGFIRNILCLSCNNRRR